MENIIFNSKLSQSERLILAGVLLRPGATGAEIVGAVGIHKTHVSALTKKLIKDGMLRKEGKRGRAGFQYFINE